MQQRSLDRRDLLRGAAALGAGALVGPAASASAFRRSEHDDPVIVVVQLRGGNDGLNTVVPYGDDIYYRARPRVALPASEVLPLDDYRGFHPALTGLRAEYDAGRLAIVEGVGFRPYNRSHFQSFDVWHTASLEGRAAGDGWLARLADTLRGEEENHNLVVHVGEATPYSLQSSSNPPVTLENVESYRWQHHAGRIGRVSSRDAESSVLSKVRASFRQAHGSVEAIGEAIRSHRPKAEYPEHRLGAAMRACAAMIRSRCGARILSVELSSFDTHANQLTRQRYLLEAFDGAVTAFLEDLRGTPDAARTTVMAFSEFGRRVNENASGGTDHGPSGPMFLTGERVRGGLYGAHPSLARLSDGDLDVSIDFRRVYASVIERWFQRDAAAVLRAEYEPLDVFV